MSRWVDKFQDHPIHQTLKTYREALVDEVDKIDAEYKPEQRRLRKVVSFIEAAVSGLDPELFPESVLDQLAQSLRQEPLWGAINRYTQSSDPNELHIVNDSIGEVVSIAYRLAVPARPPQDVDTVQEIEAAYDRFCKNVGEAEASFKERLELTETQRSTLADKVSALEQASEDLENKVDGALQEWKNTFEAAQNDQHKAFSDAQTERANNATEEISELRKASQAETKAISDEHNNRLTDAFVKYQAQVEERLADMDAKHNAIREIHGLVGTDGVAGGYHRTATDEQTAASIWRVIAMICFALTALWLIFRALFATGGLTWIDLALTASPTFVLLATAAYAARQSAIHREAEQQTRWFSLEVAAIDPFLSSLDEAEQREMKKRLAERLFGKDRAAGQVKVKGLEVRGPYSLIDGVLERVPDILKMVGKS